MSKKREIPQHVLDWVEQNMHTPTFTWLRNISPSARQKLDERFELGVKEAMAHNGKSKISISVEMQPNVEDGRIEFATDFNVAVPKVTGSFSPMKVAPGNSGRFHTYGEPPPGMGESVDNVTPIHGKK